MSELLLAVDWDALLRTFVVLFVIIDPAGNLVVFHVLTEQFTTRQRGTATLVAVLSAGCLLAAFTLIGAGVLDWLGVSAPSFRVAAGLLLLPTVYSLVTEGELPQTRGNAGLDPVQVGLVPLAMPLLAGPGALASVVAYAGTVGQPLTLAATGLVLVVTAVAFLLAAALFRFLGPALLRLVSRIVGLVVFAIATEFVVSGLIAALRTIP